MPFSLAYKKGCLFASLVGKSKHAWPFPLYFPFTDNLSSSPRESSLQGLHHIHCQ